MIALDIDRIRRAFPDRAIDYYESIDSTMVAAAGKTLGQVVVADEQTAGQGRHGHSWHSAAGDGIYCSMVLAQSPLLTLALGLAAHSAIFEATGLVCDLRWPNDLMIGEKKVAGILVQTDGRGTVAGIGINVNHAAFPPEVAEIATSLRLTAGRRFGREEIILALLPAVDAILARDRESILAAFTQLSSYASGRRVQVHQPEGILVGTTAGLDSSGFLIVRQDDGTDTLIVAGGVRAAGS